MTTSKQLLQHLSETMLSLKSRKISVDEAKAQASLVKQANNLLRYDLDLDKFNHKISSEQKKEA